MAQSSEPEREVAASLAPTGHLRVAINLGNPVLAQRDPKTGELRGVSVDLAHALGESLALPVELSAYEAAGRVFLAAQQGAWDIAFLANEPERADKIAFSAPYVIIAGTYLVRADSPYQRTTDLDRDGVRVAVGQGAAYDLFLSRTLKHAQLVRAPTSAAAIDLFESEHLDAAAGVSAALLRVARSRPQLRVLDPGFQRIEQAVALPKGRDQALAYVGAFVERMKANGFVRSRLDASGQTDAVVAPPGP